jgi:hypothetical protein
MRRPTVARRLDLEFDLGQKSAAEIARLAKNFAVRVDFKIANALETLNRFGLVRREDEQLFVLSLELAIAQLHQVWNNFFKNE